MTWQNSKPILGVVGFNLFTLLVFITAPVDWGTDNLPVLCAFVVLCQLLVFAGFWLGRHTGLPTAGAGQLPLSHGAMLVDCLFLVYALTFPISYAYKLGFAPFDIPGMVSQLLAGLRDPHYAYSWSIDKDTQSPIPWSVYFAVSIFNQFFFIAGFLRWRYFTNARKAAFTIFVGIELFYWVGLATTFGVVSLATTFGLSSMFWRGRAGGASWRRVASNVLLLGVLLAGSIAFFSYTLYRRSSFVEIDVSQYEIARRPILLGHPALAIMPEPLQPTYIKVVSYLAQGYYHTCLAFDLDFKTTAFLGNNPALISLAGAFGVDVWEDTYMHRLLSKGIDEYGLWHSAYTWFASDVSFYGVPVVLFVLGYLFGFSWVRGQHGDFLSKAVFIMFGNMLLFLFANNTYLSTVFYAFMVFVPLWIVTRVLGVRLAPGRGRAPRLASAVPAK